MRDLLRHCVAQAHGNIRGLISPVAFGNVKPGKTRVVSSGSRETEAEQVPHTRSPAAAGYAGIRDGSRAVLSVFGKQAFGEETAALYDEDAFRGPPRSPPLISNSRNRYRWIIYLENEPLLPVVSDGANLELQRPPPRTHIPAA